MSEEPKDYEILDNFGVKPQKDGLVDRAVKELGGQIRKVTSNTTQKEVVRTETGGYTDGETLIEPGLTGELETVDNNGTRYDKDGNVIVHGQSEEK